MKLVVFGRSGIADVHDLPGELDEKFFAALVKNIQAETIEEMQTMSSRGGHTDNPFYQSLRGARHAIRVAGDCSTNLHILTGITLETTTELRALATFWQVVRERGMLTPGNCQDITTLFMRVGTKVCGDLSVLVFSIIRGAANRKMCVLVRA